MKVRNKFWLIFGLFLGLIFLNNICYGAENTTNYFPDDLIQKFEERFLTDELNKYSLVAYWSSENNAVVYCASLFDDTALPLINYCDNATKAYFGFVADKTKTNGKFSRFQFTVRNMEGKNPTISNLFFDEKRYGYYTDSFLSFAASSYKSWQIYSNTNIYYVNDLKDYTFDDISVIEGLYYEANPVDKLNLFELNLTDLDYNNAVHQFNIATYTNSPNYDEIMQYYNNNNPYAVFVTNYERIMTYQEPDNDSSYVHGAYLLSGYIDFLTADDAFFYYSNYYNKFMTNSGKGIFDTSPSAYIDRFYFKSVYSEDTNDPDYTVWTSNGELFFTDLKDEFNSRNLVGTSHTIYYANEKNNGNFKNLTNDIRTLGHLNHKENGKTISLSAEKPYYVYNFNFAGGITHTLFLNQPTYHTDRENLRNELSIERGSSGVLDDKSDGMSYTQGNEIKGSQFAQGDVTDDTTSEEDEKHVGEIIPSESNKDLDTSNWGVLDYLSYWFNGMKDFDKQNNQVSNNISQSIDTVKDKFSFKDNLIGNANDIKDYIVNTQETHKYYLNINHKYLSGNVCIIDLSWYEPYKPTVDAFICAFAYLAFIWHMFCIVPSLIGGSSAGSYVSDISAYAHTGFGRSSNIHSDLRVPMKHKK